MKKFKCDNCDAKLAIDDIYDGDGTKLLIDGAINKKIRDRGMAWGIHADGKPFILCKECIEQKLSDVMR